MTQKTPRVQAAPPLFCDACHSEFTEGIAKPYGKCLYVGCNGTLRNVPPKAKRKPEKKQPPVFPLLDAAQ